MDIQIENCNNIDSALIPIINGQLNIKLAPNGTGKSTIARAIISEIHGAPDLKELMPFKLRNANPHNKSPKVCGLENVKKTMCFNEVYVNQFVFKPTELIANSFDILIRTEEYCITKNEIEELLQETQNLFVNNPSLQSLIENLYEMKKVFKLTKTGISKSSIGVKVLEQGNKIHHIPEGLESFQTFIQSENSVEWIEWQTNGYEYAETSDYCPFCTAHTADRKDQIKKVGLEYDKKTIKNLVSLIEIIQNLGDYFSPQTQEQLLAITKLKEGIDNEHKFFLLGVQRQLETFIEKLEKLRSFLGYQIRKVDDISKELESFKIDLTFLTDFQSDKTWEVITPINDSISQMQNKANILYGKLEKQRKNIQKIIETHEKDINSFLVNAGYRYHVKIYGEGEQAQLKLMHLDYEAHIIGGGQHLSFGERNAFALVLFMYECLSSNPDIIILDDPISSFDKHKKYAIIDMLFDKNTSSCFKLKTVLMLTHDVEPIIDMVKVMAHRFNNFTNASFLKLKNGVVENLAIDKNDIQTFAEICRNALASQKDDIIKLIYLRRFYEISAVKGDAYQVISNLLHKRNGTLRGIDTRQQKDNKGQYPEMNESCFCNGCNEIKEQLEGFSYEEILSRICNISIVKHVYESCTNGYEKLQICRLFDRDKKNAVIEKFIKETYHIENEFICQLDPTKFDTIPEYIIIESDKIANSVSL